MSKKKNEKKAKKDFLKERIKELQRELGVASDGILGNKTINAIWERLRTGDYCDCDMEQEPEVTIIRDYNYNVVGDAVEARYSFKGSPEVIGKMQYCPWCGKRLREKLTCPTCERPFV